MHEYDLIAEWYASDRKGPAGVPEVGALAASLGRGATLLDIGCGTGLPLTQVLLDAGCGVVALDSSLEMLARFRANFPHLASHHTTIQSCDLEDGVFDGALAWGVLFHLPIAEQARAVARVSRLLKPGGRFLFTSGDVDGSIDGRMNGVTFHYYSLSVENYRRLLAEHGLTLIDTHADAGDNTYYLAETRA